jgi:hypothetical protein
MSKIFALISGAKRVLDLISVSTGVSDSGKIPMTNAQGKLDASLIPASGGGLGDSFETVSQNLKDYPSTLNFTGELLTSKVYDLGSGQSITITYNYTGEFLTSKVLSGDTPSGILLTKTYLYSGDIFTGNTYS